MRISDEMRHQFHKRGYMVLERAIADGDLEALRAEGADVMVSIDAEIAAGRRDQHRLSVPGSRYFVSEVAMSRPRLRHFLFSDVMRQICQATLGDRAYFFLDQFVVKAADLGGKFSWHQDSGFIPFDHRPDVTCWCAGRHRRGERHDLRAALRQGGHTRADPACQDPVSNDLVGYDGEDTGDPVLAPAGTIAVFSSTTLHRSGPNRTNRMRRVYLAQYSAEPIVNPDGSLRRSAVPVFS
jgi:ectoine hydroxylase-related dioxygenase (phytanoyl-CoA dioxygenase family)